MNIIKVTGAIASKNGVTIFTSLGESMVLAQENWQTKNILEKTLVPLAMNPGSPVEIDLDTFAIAPKLEKALASSNISVTEDAKGDLSLQVKTANGDVTVAAGTKLQKHVERAVYGQGAKGFVAFMEDFARIPHKHSAEELLTFMEHGDLPIADDGSILVYKWLTKRGDACFDTHSGKVKQRLGSKVQMPIEKVNDSRRTDCATGLHVCSNRYGSYGDTLFLAKVRPSDVIAVPANETGKMRCAAYHLIGILPSKCLSGHGKDSALDNPEAKKIIANAIAGNHIGVIEFVNVGGSTYRNDETKVESVKAPKTEKRARQKPADLDYKKPGAHGPAEAVDPKTVRAQMEKAKTMQPWQAARVGDKVRVEGSKRVAKGVYEVLAVNDDNITNQRLRISYKGGHIGVANTCIKEIVGVSLENDSLLDLGPKARREAEYEAKVVKAKKMLTDGMSLRQVNDALRIDRKRLALRLKADNFTY